MGGLLSTRWASGTATADPRLGPAPLAWRPARWSPSSGGRTSLALAFGNAALGPGEPIYGLYGAIVHTGFLAALLGGTPAQVSGPTGPMSVTVAGVVSSLMAVGVASSLSGGELLPLVMAAVVLGELFQILFGLLKLGRYITLVPYSRGFGVHMSGIGIIILLIQAGPSWESPASGRDQLPGHGVSAVPPQPRRTGCWADDLRWCSSRSASARCCQHRC